jgi:alanine racemase
MLTESCFHSWSNPQGLMNSRKVVVNMEQRQRVFVVFNTLTKAVRQPSKAAHLHSHVEILSLNEASADMVRIGVAQYKFFLGIQGL